MGVGWCLLLLLVAAHRVLAGADVRSLLGDAAARAGRGDVDGALHLFRVMMEAHPDVVEGYANAGALLENRGDVVGARRVYRSGFLSRPMTTVSRRTPPEIVSHRLCGLLVNEKLRRRSAHPLDRQRRQLQLNKIVVDRWGIPNPYPDLDRQLDSLSDRHEDDGMLRSACERAARQPDHHPLSLLNVGRMHVLMDEYDRAVVAVEHAKKAGADPGVCSALLDDLYDLLAKTHALQASESDACIAYRRAAVRNRPSVLNKVELASAVMMSRPGDTTALSLLRQACRQQAEEHTRRRRVVVDTWEQFARSVDELAIPMVWPGPRPGQAYVVHRGSTLDALKSEFTEQTIVVASMTDVCMESMSGVLFDDDRVFFGEHIPSPLDYHGGVEQDRVDVVGNVVSAVPANPGNWYHWLAEGVSMALLGTHFFPNHRILIPDSAFGHDFADLFALGHRALFYQSGAGRRERGHRYYHFENLVRIDWRHAGRNDSGLDLWDTVLVPAPALLLVRRSVLAKVHALSPAKTVVYVSRTDPGRNYVRTVLDEDLLLEALGRQLGSHCMEVMYPANATTMLGQASLFSQAHLVIGPHGAGLTNILFAQPGASLVYFPMTPVVDSCFAHLAAVVNASLHVVPEMSAYYLGPYKATVEAVNAVIATVDRVIGERG
ncbi:Glycosyltransferase 61 catalytic domain-containing protein [Plasmodiophora brassicae]